MLPVSQACHPVRTMPVGAVTYKPISHMLDELSTLETRNGCRLVAIPSQVIVTVTELRSHGLSGEGRRLSLHLFGLRVESRQAESLELAKHIARYVTSCLE